VTSDDVRTQAGGSVIALTLANGTVSDAYLPQHRIRIPQEGPRLLVQHKLLCKLIRFN
jgi:hypothetical protein